MNININLKPINEKDFLGCYNQIRTYVNWG